MKIIKMVYSLVQFLVTLIFLSALSKLNSENNLFWKIRVKK
jgi:hypothetical protein